jgi:putative ABC transport system permease protein
MTDTAFSIIGIVKDVRNQGPSDVPWPGVYLPTTLTAVGNTPRMILVRTPGDPTTVVPGLERAVRAAGRDMAIRNGGTIEADMQRIFHAQPRFGLAILTAFATIGLLLVAVGVYGVMAYAVSRRSQEFAIRLALGATEDSVVGAVVRSGAVLLGAGIVIGLAASRVTNELVLSNVVLGSSGTDGTLSVVAAVAVIAVVGLRPA